jgi:hypothetical protein
LEDEDPENSGQRPAQAVSVRSYFKNKLKTNRLRAWWSKCEALSLISSTEKKSKGTDFTLRSQKGIHSWTCPDFRTSDLQNYKRTMVLFSH